MYTFTKVVKEKGGGIKSNYHKHPQWPIHDHNTRVGCVHLLHDTRIQIDLVIGNTWEVDVS